MSSRRLYQVEYFKIGLGWRQYMGACASSLDWCKGFVAAMDMQYPCESSTLLTAGTTWCTKPRAAGGCI